MTTQKFNAIGITELDGVTKVRFSTDTFRHMKRFAKAGASRIDFVDLPYEMTKLDALKYMLSCPEFQSEDDQATIADTLEEKTRKAAQEAARKPRITSLAAIAKRNRKNTSIADILGAMNA